MNAHSTFGTNLPAVIAALPDPAATPNAHAGDTPATGHTPKFTRELQVAFLTALAACGAARKALSRAGVSHQTVYRERRANPAFRHAWDAALLAARAQAEDVLACRALDGVEEKVFYHGEEVATRTRYSDRLLLAHLARLDRLTANARTHAFAEDFEGALERFAAGEDEPAVCPDCGASGEGAFSSLGQCNKCNIAASESAAKPGGGSGVRDTAHAAPAPDAEPASADPRYATPCDCPGARHGSDGGAAHYTMSAHGPRPVVNRRGEGPCCDQPRWPECHTCPHYPPDMRRKFEMDEERPADAPPIEGTGWARVAIEELQEEAFDAGVEQWWLVLDEAGLDAALERLEA